MNAALVLGALVGCLLGAGLALIVHAAPLGWRPTLEQRIAPQMRTHRPPSSLLREEMTAGPWTSLIRILGPVVSLGTESLQRFQPGHEALRRRLEAAGSDASVSDYRAQQVICAVLGASLGVVLAVVLVSRAQAHPVLAVALVAMLTVCGVLARDSMLSTAVGRRRQRVLGEFPSIAELFALSVSAGESTPGALERIATTTRGELSREFARTLADIRAGSSLAHALHACGRRLQVPAVERFIDGVVVALERGTPLADVVRAQAQDVRELSKQELMEAAGRKEVHMLVPLVFGILPLTVVFAVFPGIALMDMGF